jgi:delta 1-pyrroline-5-carboxylate dehydrogenase
MNLHWPAEILFATSEAQLFHSNFIAEEWVASTDASRNINPSGTDDLIGKDARGAAVDVKTAIASARQTFPSWARSLPQERVGILQRPKRGHDLSTVILSL